MANKLLGLHKKPGDFADSTIAWSTATTKAMTTTAGLAHNISPHRT